MNRLMNVFHEDTSQNAFRVKSEVHGGGFRGNLPYHPGPSTGVGPIGVGAGLECSATLLHKRFIAIPIQEMYNPFGAGRASLILDDTIMELMAE